MARKRKAWRFQTGAATVVEVSAGPDPTRTQIRRRGRWALVVGMLMAILGFGAVMASADNTTPDGDNTTPVAANPLAFGNVSCDVAANQDALVAISRNGSATGTNTFANGATVTVSVLSVSGAGLSAAMSSSTITLPSNWTSVANNTMSDAVSSKVTINSSTAGGGSGSVTYRATGLNSDGNTINRDATMTVTWTTGTCTPSDTTPPTLNLPASITAEATSASGAAVTYTATANDNVDGAITPTCSPASGSTFPLGTTTVNCSATDAATNTANGSFTVTVQDTTKPSLTLPADITAEATGPSGAVVTYSASATDLVDGSVAIACTPASGSTFALGTTTVNCSATDAHNDTASGSFKVAVVDTTPPTISGMPSDKTVEATGPSGAVVTWTAPTATDFVDGTLAVTCAPASGSTFALGDTTVTCSATDAHSNTASKTFKVTVLDTTPPTISGMPSDKTVEATGPSGAEVTWTAPTASDLVDGTVAVTCTPASGSTFAPGATTANCSATDAHGNTATGRFTVTVNFNFIGFLQPVDNKILNGMKAGSTAPIKWQISDGNGGYISDLSIVKSEQSGTVSCSAATIVDTLEETATGGTSLRYDFTNNQFVYNWQSPKKPGTCYGVVITLTDGSVHQALFQLK